MLIKAGINPRSDFTRIPNAVLEDTNLTPHELVLWIRLYSLTKGEEFSARKAAHAAELCGVNVDVFRDRRRSLTEKGYLQGSGREITLTMPSHEFVYEPKKPVAEPKQEELEDCIAEDVAAQPKRKPSGVTQAQACLAIIEAWNKHKPEGYMTCPPKIHPSTFIAIETQAKRLGVERPKYGDFVKRVLKGCSSDNWWREKPGMKASNIFGFGAEIPDQKFENVEKLYKMGSKVADKFSWNNDDSIFAWYDAACPDRTFTSIVHMDVPDAPTAWEHDAEHRDGDTIFIYHSLEDDGFVVNWTLGKKVHALKTPPNRR